MDNVEPAEDVETAGDDGWDDVAEEPEIVEGVVVLAGARAIEPVREGPPPLRAVAAVAATGFVAGAATAAVLGRRMTRRQATRAALAHATPADTLDVTVSLSRRFIIDVHALARR